jgi:hypothetical protein
MELKYSEMFNKTILKSVSEYCKLNSIEDVDGFVKKCFDTGFNIEKYGLLGKTLNEGEKDLKTDNEGEKDLMDPRKTGGIQEKRAEIEVIREIRVEIPVEVIKEVEKIVEVPVEVIKEIIVEKEIIKEVPVEKIVTIYDNSSENELFGKIEQLEQNIFHLNEQIESERKIFSTKIEEMENNFQNTDNNKLQMLQKTITNLNVEIRDLKIKNKELENKLLEQPKESDFTKARFHGSSNLNDDLYK